jgi:5-methylcytosine-specific restriction endonuclease McrA
MKICSKCNVEKHYSDFSKRKASKDGMSPLCKACSSAYGKKWRTTNPDKKYASNLAWAKANPEKIKASLALYKKKNPEKVAASSRKYRESNPEKVSSATRAWQKANPERVAENGRRWEKENPDSVREYNHRRRTRKICAEGSHTASDVRVIFEAQRGLCANCPRKLVKSGKNRYHVDHIQPLSRGGSNDKYNLQCLCPECNLRKHAKDPLDWAKENWRLL